MHKIRKTVTTLSQQVRTFSYENREQASKFYGNDPVGSTEVP